MQHTEEYKDILSTIGQITLDAISENQKNINTVIGQITLEALSGKQKNTNALTGLNFIHLILAPYEESSTRVAYNKESKIKQSKLYNPANIVEPRAFYEVKNKAVIGQKIKEAKSTDKQILQASPKESEHIPSSGFGGRFINSMKKNVAISFPLLFLDENHNADGIHTKHLPNLVSPITDTSTKNNQENTFQTVDNILENSKKQTLDDRYFPVDVPETVKQAFRKLSKDQGGDLLTEIVGNYIKTSYSLRPELLLASEKLRKKSTLPVLPEKLTEEQMYRPIKGLREESLRNHLLNHLEKVWGQYLTYFNKNLEEDVLYQDYLRRRDPVFTEKLYKKLYNDHRKDPSIPALEDIVKTKSARISQEVDGLTIKDAKEYSRLSIAIEKRSR